MTPRAPAGSGRCRRKPEFASNCRHLARLCWSPLDGGRITAILSPRVWLLGAPIMLGLLLVRPSPVLLLVALFAAPQVLKAWRHDPNSPEAQA
ncbi:hypothetical protein [Inquilinus limosus]|uniref:hypothetical protein n=1 Tax=Inquilinus limosus TaxID=171674 RepID=UPI0011982235|nr:hypothetical protein [Inquilinus limosus]